ncbi:putative E3 ubiquitin ligase SUD1 [Citrus sinensis]|uniref:E3 ubiquitin ligase SUD1 n=1 Tax=Citrus sinensis TaxID=2711 RepID=A0ACB8IET9_CITSI|nr:putative E3 ubiquitin ligase SUD1 [Citrus sinensis]
MDVSTSPRGGAMASSSFSSSLPANSPEPSLSTPSMKRGAEESASMGAEDDREKTSSTGFDIEEEEEEEEEVCRICRNPGDPENPLRYPCACSGSIKFVHQDCLLQWLNHSNARQCEVCKHAFSFSPVYAENAPARLPFQEFIVGMAMKAYHVLQFFLRLSFVLSVWLLIIPFITFWIWRLAFVRSFGEAQRLFLSHISTTVILTDCLHGFLLSASIVFIFLGATSLRDYFRHLREIGGQDAEREDEGDRNVARAARRPPGQANRNFAGEGNAEDAGGAPGIAGAGQMIRRNAENVAARWEMQAARLEAHVEQMFDGLDDADGAEDVPFDELVGMQGPVFHLVENAFTVLASNMIFLGVVIFLPFSLGRIILYYVSWLLSSASGPVLSSVMPLTETALSLANITLKNALSAVTNLTSEGQEGGLLGQVADVLKGNASEITEAANSTSASLSADMLKEATMGTSRLSDVTTLAIGYMFIFSLVFFYLGIVALIRYTKGEPLTMGRFYGIASIAETIPSLFRQFLAAMRHLMTMIKVAFLLVIELGVFPLMCGWWLDVCTIRMFGKSMSERVQFFSVSPLASSLVHWVVGIVYMLQISIFVSLLRGVLRNGVLYFLRDPADPNYNPFRDLIDDPVHKHARRVLLSVAVYGSLIVMLVFLPVKLAMRMATSIFPLDISVSDPFTEIPADMLLFQICIPFAIEHFKLRTTIKSLLRYWFTAVGWALGLTDFLLPRPEDNGGQENGNIDIRRDRNIEIRRDGLQVIPLGPDRALIGMPAVDDINRGALVSGNSNVSEEYDGDEQSDSEYGFVLRIVLLLVIAWMTLLVINSALIVVPISLGRALFNAIPLLPITHGVKCNGNIVDWVTYSSHASCFLMKMLTYFLVFPLDLYAFIIGSYVIWTAVAGARYSIEHVRTKRAAILFKQIWKWCGIVVKSTALLSIWIFVIPVLIGLLFELLVIVPMRVPVDESPVFLLYQDWALGLIFLKIWTRLVMLDHMMPLVDESWRIKFERVREDGFSRLQGLWVLREIVFPIIMKLLTALCVPYVLARGVFPVLGYPLVVNSAVYRFAWLGCLCFSVLWFCAKRFHVWFTNLHNSIRDDRYLIGRRLHNFGEDILEKQNDEGTSSEMQNSGSHGTGLIQSDREADVGLRLRRAH